MAQDVVDVLEPVEVHQQHRDTRSAVLGFTQRDRRLLVEPSAVGEPGERVVRRLVVVPLHLGAQAARRAQDDAEECDPEECEAGDEQRPEVHDVVVDPGGNRCVGKVDLERARRLLIRGELDRRVHLEELVVAPAILRVLGPAQITDLRLGLAVERLFDLGVGRELPADEHLVVGVDDATVAVPDLDARHVAAEEPGAQRAVEVDDLRGRQAARQLAGREM